MESEANLLIEFIDKAVRNYKYGKPTGAALKSAVRVFSEVLQDDEKNSLELFEKRVDDIVNRIDIKFPKKYSAESLMVYKSRVLRAINDYRAYGRDAQAMAGWSPKQKRPTTSAAKKTGHSKTTIVRDADHIIEGVEVRSFPGTLPMLVPSQSDGQGVKMENIDLPLQGGRGITIYYPADLSVNEAEKVASILKGIASLSEA